LEFNKITRIMTPTDSYEEHYPQIVELANRQLEKQFWTSTEMKVSLDRMQLLYELSPQQLHAVKYVLILFLRYELIVGEELWLGLMAKLFPRPEVKMACSVMGMTELAIHARFYNQINKELGLDNDYHYMSYLENPILKGRVEWLDEVINGEDKLLSAIVFGLTETALLFSSFAILKSFQSNGHNKIPVIVRGTNQSALDEDLHGMLAAEIINTHYSEMGLLLKDDELRVASIDTACLHAYEHEAEIVDQAIVEDSLNGVDKQEYKEFVKYRINIFRERLGLNPIFTIGKCDIVDWFETNTYPYKMIDFFTSGVGSEYESAWDEEGFVRGYIEGQE